MTSTETNSRQAVKTAIKVMPENFRPLSVQERFDYISIAAYYKAEARNFASGQEIEDWLQAEAEFEALQQGLARQKQEGAGDREHYVADDELDFD